MHYTHPSCAFKADSDNNTYIEPESIYITCMHKLALILSDLRAAIAVAAARDRRLTVLLVAVWARISRMGTRLERLIAQWRSGKLPKSRAPRAKPTARPIGKPATGPGFPTAPGWLRLRVWETGAFGSQLQHLLSEAEWVEFLAAVPQAGRILRPLCRMLLADVMPEVLRRAPRPVVAGPKAFTAADGDAPRPDPKFLSA